MANGDVRYYDGSDPRLSTTLVSALTTAITSELR